MKQKSENVYKLHDHETENRFDLIFRPVVAGNVKLTAEVFSILFNRY